MIIVHLKGGLGNQLFQYAFGRSLSYNLNKELFLDTSYFSHSEKRKHVIFGLNSFNIKGIVGNYPYINESSIGIDYLSDSEVELYTEGIKDNFPKDIFDYEVIKDIKNLKSPAYFDGYFQQQIKNNEQNFLTENFFKINNKLIHEDLQYKLPLNECYDDIVEDIRTYDSIALHVRHGDYMDLPEFGLCTKEYYQNSIDYIVSNVKNPKFFIFTEDHEWVENNLKIDFPVEHIYFNEKINATGRGYAELLKIMSLCDHFIIANSTFSWWASFLSENDNKIIIAPKPWFQDRSFIEVDSIDKVKVKNVLNNYNKLFSDSRITLYEINENNVYSSNLNLKRLNNTFNLSNLNNDSKLFLSDINSKDFDNSAIINIKFNSNGINCLKVYYKTLDEDYCEKNSRALYYYKNDKVSHCLIIPKEAILDELMIKPYCLENDGKNSIENLSITIKEIINDNEFDETQLHIENNNLKYQIIKTKRDFSKKLKEKEIIFSENLNELNDKNNMLQEKYDSVAAELNDKNNLFVDLQGKYDSVAAELNDKNNLFVDLQGKYDSVAAELNDKNNLFVDLQGKYDSVAAELNDKNNLFVDLQGKYDSVAAELNDKNNLFVDLQGKYDSVAAELNDKNNLFVDLQGKYDSVAAELNDKNNLFVDLQGKYDSVAAELNDKNNLFVDLQGKYDSVAAELNDKNNLFVDLQGKYDSVAAELNDKNNLFVDLQGKYDSVAAELNDKNNLFADLQKKNDHITNILNEKSNQINELLEINKSHENLINELREECLNLNEVITDKNEEIINLKKEFINKLNQNK